MKKIKRATCVLLCVAFVATLFSGCGKQEPKEIKTINVSEVTHSVFYAPQYAAINLGYFAEEGLNVVLTNAGGADKVMASLLAGSADIGFAGPEAAIYVYLEGKEDYAQVFAQVTKRDGSFLMARTGDASTFKWSDLEGKTILPGRKGGVPYMTFEYVVRKNGIVPGKNTKFDDSIAFNNMAAAFAGGTADYVTLFEPTASSFEAKGYGKVVASIGESSGEIPYTAYFANKSYIKNNADTMAAFTRALYKGQQWVQEHSAKEIAEVLAPSFADTDLALLTSAIQRYKDIDAWNTTPVMEKEAFENLCAVMSQAGELKQSVDFEKIVDNSFATKAAK